MQDARSYSMYQHALSIYMWFFTGALMHHKVFMHLSICAVFLFKNFSGYPQAFRDEPVAIQSVQKCCRRKFQGLLQGNGSFLWFPKQKSVTLKLSGLLSIVVLLLGIAQAVLALCCAAH